MTDSRRYLPLSAPHSEASPALRTAVRDEQAAIPSPEYLAIMASKVQRILDAPSASPIATLRAPTAARGLRRSLSVSAVAVVGATVLALALRVRPPAEQRPRALPSSSAQANAGSAPAAPTSRLGATPTTREEPATAAHRATLDAAQHANQTRAVTRPARRARAIPLQPAQTIGSAPAEDLALLLQARRALGAVPANALPLLEQHAREYPHSAFAEEREALAVEAIAVTSSHEQAARRAHRFLESFPHSAYRRRIEALLDSP